jgi:hypothetical protein
MRRFAIKHLERHGTIRGTKIDADAEFRVRHSQIKQVNLKSAEEKFTDYVIYADWDLFGSSKSGVFFGTKDCVSEFASNSSNLRSLSSLWIVSSFEFGPKYRATFVMARWGLLDFVDGERSATRAAKSEACSMFV